jgi:hypothetical protein
MTRVFPLLLAAFLTLPAAASAQQFIQSDSERNEALEALAQNPNDARRVQMELRRLLNEHPPSLRTVLQADPSLIDRPDYLAPYPRLAAFLKQHPEIARNPGFFFGQSDFGWYFRDRTPQERASEALQAVLAGVAAFTVAMALLFVLASLVRQAFGYRRWLRQSRVQTEVHTKILDRLQSNEELIAYIQTPAGQRFLEAGPSPRREPEPRAIGAPLGRILWSVQAGVMLLALGIGFWLVQQSAVEELAPAFGAMGTLAAVLGAGAICASATSYVLSARLGLLPAKEAKE